MSTSTLTPRTHLMDVMHKKTLNFKQDLQEKGSGKRPDILFKPGQHVFTRKNDLTWDIGSVRDVKDGFLVVNIGDTQEFEVPAKEAVLVPTDDLYERVEDLTDISPLSEPAVLRCLACRYNDSEIYTWAGNTLVALNPFKENPHLYGTKAISQYHQLHKAEDSKGGPPHVYSVAARAYNSMRCGALHPDQSIIVSGESGAGKTVSARHLMKYLVTVANNSPIGNESFGCEIERRILNSNPILEAFGNAGTLRNDNSSRFGKYVELQFDKYGYVSGAAIQTYLLEKTRVVQHAAGEHTFHIFYQLLAGLDKEQKDKLALNSVALSTSGRSLDDDEGDWQATIDALSSIKVSCGQLQDIIHVLAAIIHLSQISVTVDEEDEDLCCIDNEEGTVPWHEGPAPSQLASQLLGIDPQDLATALTHRRITASHSRRKSVFSKPCSQTETRGRADCLAKLLYNQLFEWLVAIINRCIFTDQVRTTIGILDIYGFESFLTNSLEQLCINYANERLQQHYVTHFLRDLQAEYCEEAISWSDVEFVDNRPCLTLLEGAGAGSSSPGLFPLINEECQVNRPGGDEGLRDRLLSSSSEAISLNKSGRNSPGQLGTPRQNRTDPSFIINHYAGPVTYSVCGLLEKNKDNVPPELIELLRDSSNPFIVKLFQKFEAELPGKKKKTVLAKFKSSLDHLMEALGRTDPHYIRCIKPNQISSPTALEEAFVLQQLQACGIVETVDVNRKGYPSRIPYERFLQHYSLILRSMPEEDGIHPAQADVSNKENELVFDPLDVLYQKQLQITPRKQNAATKKKHRRRAGLSSCDHTRKLTASILCLVFGQEFRHKPNSICQFGITKLFLRDGMLEQLERVRLKLASNYVFTLQCAWRRVMQRRRIRHRAAATKLQSAWRGFIQRRQYQKSLVALKVIQKGIKSWLARRRSAEEATLRALRSQESDYANSSADLRLNLSDVDNDDGSLSEFLSARSGLSGTDSEQTPRECYLTPQDCCDSTLIAQVTPTSSKCSAEAMGSGSFTNGQQVGKTPEKTVIEHGSGSYDESPFSGDALPPHAKSGDYSSYNTPPASGMHYLHHKPTSPGRDNGITLYTSPKADKGHMSPVTVPLVRIPCEVDKGEAGDAQPYYVVCEARADGCNTYHIMPSPCPGGRRERATDVLRRVTTSISTSYLSQWRFNLAGAFRGIPYLEAQNGIVSRRRMPRVQIKFHTRANDLLDGAHLISHREFQCSLSDCLE